MNTVFLQRHRSIRRFLARVRRLGGFPVADCSIAAINSELR